MLGLNVKQASEEPKEEMLSSHTAKRNVNLNTFVFFVCV